jgi:hypothetical protein
MRAWLSVVLTLPIVLTGCPAVLSDWNISRSGGTDASVDAAGPDAAGGSSGSGRGGSSGSGGGSSSGGSVGSGGSSGSGGSGGATGGSGGAPIDSGSCANDLSDIQTGDFHISFDVLSMPQSSGPLLEQRAVCDPYSVDWLIAEQLTYNIIVQIGDGAGYVNLDSIATINDGVWHHVVVARVSATLSITIDRQLDNSIPNGGVSLGPLALLQVGKSACAAPFAGQVKNVCISRH